MKIPNKLTKVSMNLSAKSIRNVDELSEILNETNKTRVVSMALEITKCIIQQLDEGKRIIIRSDNGSDQEMTFIIT